MVEENYTAKNFRFLYNFYEEKQEVIAKNFDVSQNTISNYMTGKVKIKQEILIKIAERYGVSIDDLIKKDLSLEFDIPIVMKTENVVDITKKVFPRFKSKKAESNDNFNRAFKITKRAYQVEDIKTLNSNLCIFEHAIELYKKAWEEIETYTALANSISLILFIYSIYNQYNRISIDNLNILKSKEKISFAEFKRNQIKDETTRTQENPYLDKKVLILEKYYEQVFESIKKLKENENFSDLGDYYLAMCYLIGFENGGFDYNSCVETAMMMLFQQVDLNNPFAKEFLERWLFIGNTDN